MLRLLGAQATIADRMTKIECGICTADEEKVDRPNTEAESVAARQLFLRSHGIQTQTRRKK